jgi:hypothetical protein
MFNKLKLYVYYSATTTSMFRMTYPSYCGFLLQLPQKPVNFTVRERNRSILQYHYNANDNGKPQFYSSLEEWRFQDLVVGS